MLLTEQCASARTALRLSDTFALFRWNNEAGIRYEHSNGRSRRSIIF